MATEHDRLLTLDDCAKWTSESRSTWDKRVQANQIPHIRLGKVKCVRVRQSVLEAFIAAKEQPKTLTVVK